MGSDRSWGSHEEANPRAPTPGSLESILICHSTVSNLQFPSRRFDDANAFRFPPPDPRIILSSDKAKQGGICGAKGAVIILSIDVVRWICSALPRLCHHFMFHWFMSQEDLACGKGRVGMPRLNGCCAFECFAILIEDWDLVSKRRGSFRVRQAGDMIVEPSHCSVLRTMSSYLSNGHSCST